MLVCVVGAGAGFGTETVVEPPDEDLLLDEDDDFDDEPVPSSSTPFLDQLRRAVDDEGADEGAMSDFFGSDLDESPRSRFGRRR